MINNYPIFGFILTFFITLACKTGGGSKAEEQCNSSNDHIWHEGSCQFRDKVDLENKRRECLKNSHEYRWINNVCIKKDDFHTPRERCENMGDGSYWQIDPQTTQGTCIGPTNKASREEACFAKIEQGHLWDGDRCLSPKGQNCIAGGDHWTHQGTCISQAEKLCVDRQDGSKWNGKRCVSGAEILCNNRGFNFVWKSDKTSGNMSCQKKNFIDYCYDYKNSSSSTPEDIALTVEALLHTPGVNSKDCYLAEKNLENRTSLVLSERKLTNLAPLSGFSSLEFIDLQGNEIKNLAFLKGFYRIKEINLSKNNVSDLEPLKDLHSLVSLRLSNNEIAELSHLSTLPNLESLFLRKNRISSIDRLVEIDANLQGGLKNLRNLDLSDNCGLQNIDLLVRLPKLEYLSIDLTRVEKIPKFVGQVTISQTTKCAK